MDYVQIPRDIIQMNKFVTLIADEIYVNSLPFVIYEQGIGLITAEFMPNCTAYQLVCSLKKIIRLHSRAGFTILCSWIRNLTRLPQKFPK